MTQQNQNGRLLALLLQLLLSCSLLSHRMCHYHYQGRAAVLPDLFFFFFFFFFSFFLLLLPYIHSSLLEERRVSGQLEGTLPVIRDHRWFWSRHELGSSGEKSLLGTLTESKPALEPGIHVLLCRQEESKCQKWTL